MASLACVFLRCPLRRVLLPDGTLDRSAFIATHFCHAFPNFGHGRDFDRLCCRAGAAMLGRMPFSVVRHSQLRLVEIHSRAAVLASRGVAIGRTEVYSSRKKLA
eukprot:5582423-Pleurochrysis_carterae.AAC.1